MLKLGWDLLWTIINLIILYLLMKKFLIGPITGIMEKRKNLIAQQFKDAETVQNQAQEMKTQYETALSGAKEESVQIIADARSDAKALSERTLKDANEKASRILENARNTAEQEKQNAMSGAKSEIADLALEAAKKLLSQGSSKEGNSMLYDQFLAETGDTDDRN